MVGAGSSIAKPLRIVYGLVPLLAGLDKFFFLLADWSVYLSPAAEAVLPVPEPVFFYAIGIVEMAVGVLVLTRWTRIGAWVAAAWLTLVAVNLALNLQFDIAVRDLAMAVGAATLARLVERRETVEARRRAPAGAEHPARA